MGEVPPAIIPHSPVGESVLTDLALNKCGYALPFYRQERMMRDMGVPIRRNVMAGWFISTADLLRPLWEAMKEAMKKLNVIHADETFGQVLHNSTGNPRAQLDFWAYCSGKWETIQVACFEYCDSREGKTPGVSWMDTQGRSLQTAAHRTKQLSIWYAGDAGHIPEDIGIMRFLRN